MSLEPLAQKEKRLRDAYLDQLQVWSRHFSPPDRDRLRKEANVRDVVRALAKSPTWETRNGAFHIVLTHRWVSERARKPYVVFVPEPVRRRVRRLRHNTCFLGCRFREPHKSLLENNLRDLLRCYGLSLEADDSDKTFRELFSGIVRRIRRAPVCLFDSRFTRGKPNVFIECGISFAAGKVTVLAEPRSGHAGASVERPSDFSGMVSVRYSSYKDLMDQLCVWLPHAFRKHLS